MPPGKQRPLCCCPCFPTTEPTCPRDRPRGLRAELRRCCSGCSREGARGAPGPNLRAAVPTKGRVQQGAAPPAHCRSHLALPSRNAGYVVSIMGRRRPLPRIRARDPQLRAQAERQAVNFVVQGARAPLLLGFQPQEISARVYPALVLLAVTAGSRRAGAQHLVPFLTATRPTRPDGRQAPGGHPAGARARPGAQSLDPRPGLSATALILGRRPNPSAPTTSLSVFLRMAKATVSAWRAGVRRRSALS